MLANIVAGVAISFGHSALVETWKVQGANGPTELTDYKKGPCTRISINCTHAPLIDFEILLIRLLCFCAPVRSHLHDSAVTSSLLH
jgi:hypothetical protein